jgi:hypothetical protein
MGTPAKMNQANSIILLKDLIKRHPDFFSVGISSLMWTKAEISNELLVPLPHNSPRLNKKHILFINL